MKTYIEELEDLSTHGVTVYSMIQGMSMYRAEVRASGIEITKHNEDGDGKELEHDDEKYKELSEQLTKELYK